MRLRAETAAAIEAARAAGRLLMRSHARVGGVRLKGPKDPVTVVDAGAERIIRGRLARRFPAIGFLGEEGTVAAGTTDARWIVDPLDGTIAYVAGLPTYGVSIALESAGIVECGVLLLPRLDELFVAERGRGAWLGGRRIRVSRRRDPARCVISLWHDDSVWRDRPLRERIARLSLRVRSVNSGVGAVFSLAYVAAGRLDGYWEQSAHPWDLAAGALVVREAGGRVTDGLGRPLDISQPTVVASSGPLHASLVGLLRGRRRTRHRLEEP